MLDHLSSTTLDATHIKRWIDANPVLARFGSFAYKVGLRVPLVLISSRILTERRSYVTVFNGCVLWGSRVIVLPQGQAQVLNKLHESYTARC